MIFPRSYDQNYTLESLKTVRPSRPKNATKQWRGINHHDLLEAFQKAVENMGWTGTSIRCFISPGRSRMAASLRIDGPDPPIKKSTCSIGLYNSLNQTSRLWYYIGICLEEEDVGLVFDKLSGGRHSKHQPEDIDKKLLVLMTLAKDSFHRMPARVDALKRRTMSIETALQKLWRAGQEGLTISTVGNLQKQLEPRQTSWDMIIKFAKEMKKASPLDQMNYLHKFLNQTLKG